MYVAQRHICFTSNIFGETRLVLPVADLRSVQRQTSMLVVPDAIEVVCG